MSVFKSLSCIVRTSRYQILKQYGSQLEVCRGLYSASSMGIDGYIEQREKIKGHLVNIDEKFRSKMRENVEESSKAVIFTEDLKNFAHLAQGDDIDTIVKMMIKFNNQNKELRFGSYIFGPVIMRMFYVLDKPSEAFECFKLPELKGFFDQLITYQLLCDLLYEHKRYQDLFECISIIKERQVEGSKYPRNVIVLAYAACYKLNTPESLKYAMDLWKELSDVGHIPARRASTFFIGLLINHDKSDVGLEILSGLRNLSYTTLRNLKLLALTKLNRLDEILPVMKSILGMEQLSTFNKDVLDTVRECVEKSNNTELQTEFKHVMKIFQDQNHICDLTLDEQLTSEISKPPNFQDRYPNNYRNQKVWRPRQPFRRYERTALPNVE